MFYMKFVELNLHPDLQRGIDEAEFTDCTPVQEQTISLVLQGKDVTVQSQTGTGKTAAFLLPLFQLALQSLENGSTSKGARALIIAPTRELAVQIYEEAKMLGKHLPFRSAAFYGGVGYKEQEQELSKGVDFIIGTPGRLMDFESSGKIDFSTIDYLIVDEADRLFDMGFYPDLQAILRKMKSRRERRTLLFSATLGTRVMNIAWEHMNEPVNVEIEPEHITVEAIEQTLFHVARDEKMSVLLGLLKKYDPQNAIIFTNTKRAAEEVSKRLSLNGFACEFIMGDLPQSKRLKIIGNLKNGQLHYLVATDVAARGLHIDNLEMVINYDIPEDSEGYVHRIGRTARAGKSGRAISLADERYVYGLSAIEHLIGTKIPVGEITEDLMVEDLSRGRRIHLDRDAQGDFGRPNSRGGSRDSSRSRPAAGSGPRGRVREPGAGAAGSERPPRPRKVAETARTGSKPAPRPRNTPTTRPAVQGRSRSMTPEERIEFYKKKYGEDFDIQGNRGTESEVSAKRNPKPRAKARTTETTGPQKETRASIEKGKSKTKDSSPAVETPKPKGFLGFVRSIFGKKNGE